MQTAAEIFRALADPTRLRIVTLLRAMELSVGELAHVLGQSQPRVSRRRRRRLDDGGVERAVNAEHRAIIVFERIAARFGGGAASERDCERENNNGRLGHQATPQKTNGLPATSLSPRASG